TALHAQIRASWITFWKSLRSVRTVGITFWKRLSLSLPDVSPSQSLLSLVRALLEMGLPLYPLCRAAEHHMSGGAGYSERIVFHRRFYLSRGTSLRGADGAGCSSARFYQGENLSGNDAVNRGFGEAQLSSNDADTATLPMQLSNFLTIDNHSRPTKCFA